MKNLVLLFVLLLGSTIFQSCEKEDPVPPNQEEIITTLLFTMTPSTGGTPIVLSFKDLDGDGGNEPTISEGTLEANTKYSCSIQVLNELEDPADDITLEVKQEADEHQFFYSSTISDIEFSGYDLDGNDAPLGTTVDVKTGEVGSGSFRITLRHEPNKSAAGVSDGDITNAGGETDIEVTFPIDVQ